VPTPIQTSGRSSGSRNSWVENGIDCDWERAANYVYTEDEERLSDLRDELETMRRVGIAAELTREDGPPLSRSSEPFEWRNRRSSTPRRFLQGLAEKIPGEDSHLFEQTLATDVRCSDECTVVTERGTIRAAHVVLCDPTPVPRPRAFLRKSSPAEVVRDRSASARVRGSARDVHQRGPTHTLDSLRARPEGSRFLLIGGGGSPGRGATTTPRQRYEASRRLSQGSFRGAGDRVPLVDARLCATRPAAVYRPASAGRRTDTGRHPVLPSGGLTKGVAAAAILADTISGSRQLLGGRVRLEKGLSLKNSAPKFRC